MSEPVNRSPEELRMRELVVPHLREMYPTARIIHELPLRFSSNRIDLAAVTETEIIAVEIKSSRDVIDRLENQIRAFSPIVSRMIVALAPKWNVSLPLIEEERPDGGKRWRAQYTETQQIINRIGGCEVWTVDATTGLVDRTKTWATRPPAPWGAEMLHMLHVVEIAEVAGRHRIIPDGPRSKKPNHLDYVKACARRMTGDEIAAAVCRALRRRDAFDRASDPPMIEVPA